MINPYLSMLHFFEVEEERPIQQHLQLLGKEKPLNSVGTVILWFYLQSLLFWSLDHTSHLS